MSCSQREETLQQWQRGAALFDITQHWKNKQENMKMAMMETLLFSILKIL